MVMNKDIARPISTSPSIHPTMPKYDIFIGRMSCVVVVVAPERTTCIMRADSHKKKNESRKDQTVHTLQIRKKSSLPRIGRIALALVVCLRHAEESAYSTRLRRHKKLNILRYWCMATGVRIVLMGESTW